VIHAMSAIAHIGHAASVLVLISGLLIGFAMVWTMQSTAAPKPKMTDYVQCMDGETREDLRTVMREGINQAMKNQTIRMFENWMKDPAEQPSRAVSGMHNSVKAYVGSLKVLNEWSPPSC